MANLFGALLRGAAGRGLTDMTQRWDREEASWKAEQARRQEKEEDRRWREEQAALDRESRAAGRAGSSSSGGGSSGGGGSDYKVAFLMKKFGISEAEARQQIEASAAGTNIFERQADKTEMVDEGDGRQRSVTSRATEPDPERWAELNRTLAEAMIRGPSMGKSNYDQLTQGFGNDASQARVNAAEEGLMPVDRAADLNAAQQGKTVDRGNPLLDQARIDSEAALAAQRRAAAARPATGMTPEERAARMTSEERRRAISSITTELGRLQAEMKNMNRADREDADARIAMLRSELDALRGTGLPAAAPSAPAPNRIRYDAQGNRI